MEGSLITRSQCTVEVALALLTQLFYVIFSILLPKAMLSISEESVKKS